LAALKIIIHLFWRTTIFRLASPMPKQKPNDTIYPRIKIRGYKDLTTSWSFKISVKPLCSLRLGGKKNTHTLK
jgi:hypothetical protein